jgi:hypothetical protein
MAADFMIQQIFCFGYRIDMTGISPGIDIDQSLR